MERDSQTRSMRCVNFSFVLDFLEITYRSLVVVMLSSLSEEKLNNEWVRVVTPKNQAAERYPKKKEGNQFGMWMLRVKLEPREVRQLQNQGCNKRLLRVHTCNASISSTNENETPHQIGSKQRWFTSTFPSAWKMRGKAMCCCGRKGILRHIRVSIADIQLSSDIESAGNHSRKSHANFLPLIASSPPSAKHHRKSTTMVMALL